VTSRKNRKTEKRNLIHDWAICQWQVTCKWGEVPEMVLAAVFSSIELVTH
jgi:hypothetical protein